MIKTIFMVLVLLLIVSCGNSIEEDCYQESLDLWDTVNQDYPYFMTSQESYDKNNRQACASFYYIACINGNNLNCAETLKEKE